MLQHFFMLYTSEHEIHHANNCQYDNNCWHKTFISIVNTTSESESEKSHYFSAFYFSE